MWVFARYWFRLTLEEFGELTMPEFWELWEQRQIEFRRNCFLQGITTSAVYNVQRSDSKQHVFTPFDFSVSRSAEEEQRDAIVLMLKKTTAPLRSDHPDRIPEAREKCLLDLKNRGVEDADNIVAEVFGDQVT
jgi:hypothetical protein